MLRKMVITFILFTGIICAGYTYVAGTDGSSSGYMPLSTAADDVQAAFQQTVAAFELYTRFFSDVDEIGIYNISRHGSTYKEAFAYFQQGFEDELSHRLLKAFTRLDSQLNQQVIVPCDGLPVLRPEDAGEVQFCQTASDLLIFEIRYRNCYNPGDCYVYRVTCHRLDSKWKIKDLDLQPLQENEI